MKNIKEGTAHDPKCATLSCEVGIYGCQWNGVAADQICSYKSAVAPVLFI